MTATSRQWKAYREEHYFVKQFEGDWVEFLNGSQIAKHKFIKYGKNDEVIIKKCDNYIVKLSSTNLMSGYKLCNHDRKNDANCKCFFNIEKEGTWTGQTLAQAIMFNEREFQMNSGFYSLEIERWQHEFEDQEEMEAEQQKQQQLERLREIEREKQKVLEWQRQHDLYRQHQQEQEANRQQDFDRQMEQKRMLDAQREEEIQKMKRELEELKLQSLEKCPEKELKRHQSEAAVAADRVSKINLSEEQIAELKESFSLFDKDGDGAITVKELGDVMRSSMDQELTESDVEEMISEMDENKNGTVSFDEFLSVVGRKKMMDVEEEMLNAFQTFDKDNSGFISVEELGQIMKVIGKKLTESEIKLMIKHADGNEDNQINFEEFVKIMKFN